MVRLLEFGIFIAADAWLRCVSPGRAAEVAIAKVAAAKMVDTGQFLQLVEVLWGAAVPSVAALSRSPSVPPATVLFPLLRAVLHLVHAETSVVVTEALEITSAILV